MLPTRLGISVSASALTLTGRAHVTGNVGNGFGNMTSNDAPDIFRYEVTVDGTSIKEYYEFDAEKPCSEVENIWLDDVESNWTAAMAEAFSDRVTAHKLWQTTQNNSSEVIAIPPTTEDSEE